MFVTFKRNVLACKDEMYHNPYTWLDRLVVKNRRAPLEVGLCVTICTHVEDHVPPLPRSIRASDLFKVSSIEAAILIS